MADDIASIGSSHARQNFQFALLYATIGSQDTLGAKQITDSEAGTVANDLLIAEYDAATTVLQEDTDAAQAAAEEGADEFNVANQVYQNDSAVCQTGESNANTAVSQIQTQVSQDGTNLSNLVSLATTLIQVGGYIAGLIGHAY